MEIPISVLFFLRKPLEWLFRLRHGIEGVWDYECIVASDAGDGNFPKQDHNSHGGICKIIASTHRKTTTLRVNGLRTWQGIKGKDDDSPSHQKLSHPVEWESILGSFVSNKKILYTYQIRHEPVYGLTVLDLLIDQNQRKLSPRGLFYYIPSRDHGESDDYYEKVIADRHRGVFGKIYGSVVLSNQRKSDPNLVE